MSAVLLGGGGIRAKMKYSSKLGGTVANIKQLFVLYNLIVSKVALMDSDDHGTVTLPFKTAGYRDASSWNRAYSTNLSEQSLR